MVILIIIIIVLVLFALMFRKPDKIIGKPCVVCGSYAKYGYSEHAEEEYEKIKPLCRECLKKQLISDYPAYQGQALVIQPASGPPCYVFQPMDRWKEAFPRTQIYKDVELLLDEMDNKCYDCSKLAHYVWIESGGIESENFSDILDKGLYTTLLKQNPNPTSLCGDCCVKRIMKQLEEKDIEYIEVCSPKGNKSGFVVPMGY